MFILKVFIYAFLIQSAFSYKINETCPTNCNCDLTLNSLTLLCNQPINDIVLPNKSVDLNIFYTSTIIVRLSYLNNFPLNLCDFATYLNYLDLSQNTINGNITDKTFSCLYQLQVLNLSSNAIRYISESAFRQTFSISILDLSRNRLTFLPVTLFAGKLPNLQYLFLQNNFIEELDPWYFALPKLVRLNLANNLITKFTNYLNFDIYNQSYNGNLQPQIGVFDLRGNRVFKFDDNVLKIFKVRQIFISLKI